MIHHISLKGIIHEALTNIKLSQEEVVEIDPKACKFFHFTNAEMTDDNAELENIDSENTINDDKLINIPFEIFHTGVGYGITTKRVATKALVIKCNIKNGKILLELMLNMAIDKNIAQYIPVGMANIMGLVPYMHLICQNNTYLQSMATIPVLGFTDSTVNYMILVNNGILGATQTIREILMSTNWCTQIKPTQTPG